MAKGNSTSANSQIQVLKPTYIITTLKKNDLVCSEGRKNASVVETLVPAEDLGSIPRPDMATHNCP